MKIIVCGGDGFCGWPISLGLNAAGHDVTIVDNLSRRHIDVVNETASLTPIANIHRRIKAWAGTGLAGGVLKYLYLDIGKNYVGLLDLIHLEDPDCIVHLAEQRAAPYSMKNSSTRRYTVFNNIGATHNLLNVILSMPKAIHLVHIGSTGVYGYDSNNHVIGEGTMCIMDSGGKEIVIRHPTDPGSVYHMTKCMDAEMFYFYNKNYGLPITDLHQGIVWGTNTAETLAHPAVINRFDYDGDYGTVLNRFLMQAAVEHPLTVYGTGMQTRGFIHIWDTVKCVRLAVEQPPDVNAKNVRIFNQVTEEHTVLDLAERVAVLTGSKIKHYANPRVEASFNKLRFSKEGLLGLGLEPTKLGDGLMEEEFQIAYKYKDRCDPDKIICTSTWRKGMEIDRHGK